MKFSHSVIAFMVACSFASPMFKKDSLPTYELSVAASTDSDLNGEVIRFDNQGRWIIGEGSVSEFFFEPSTDGVIMSENPTGLCLSSGNGGILQWSTDIHDALGSFAIVDQILTYCDKNQFVACPIGDDFFVSYESGCSDGVEINLKIEYIVQ